MRITIGLLALAVGLLPIHASAQTSSRYYMRERIVGMPKASATSTPPAPVYSCGAFAQNSGPGDYTARHTLGTTTSATTAQALCNAKATELKSVGFCGWNSSSTNTNAGWPPLEVNFLIGGKIYTGLWSGTTASSLNASTCTKS